MKSRGIGVSVLLCWKYGSENVWKDSEGRGNVRAVTGAWVWWVVRGCFEVDGPWVLWLVRWLVSRHVNLFIRNLSILPHASLVGGQACFVRIKYCVSPLPSEYVLLLCHLWALYWIKPCRSNFASSNTHSLQKAREDLSY